MKKYINVVFVLGLLMVVSCSKDFLEPTLSTSKDVNTSVNTVDDLNALLVGALDRMNASTYYGQSFVVYQEVRSDNAYSNGNSGRFVGPAQFFLNSTDAYPTDTWTQMYSTLAPLNIIINASIIDSGDGLVDYVKGQAYAMRALVYMDLVRLYGQQPMKGTLGVPLITEFNDGNIYPSRATLTETWAQIGEDLTQAITLMDPALDSGDPGKMSYWAAVALQSRYYLYVKNWTGARDAAKAVIDSGIYDLTDNSWSDNGSSDSIFELNYTPTDNLGNTGLQFIYGPTVYGDVVVTTDLYDTYENTDVRKSLFTTSGTTIRTTKYPDVNYLDAIKVIRYAEVLLNYAEALTQLGNADALDALNVIPTERLATPYASATIDNVLLERRKELCMEGHRFFDLMRYEKDIVKVDSRQTFGDAIRFGDYRLTFPIPNAERIANPNIEQNGQY